MCVCVCVCVCVFVCEGNACAQAGHHPYSRNSCLSEQASSTSFCLQSYASLKSASLHCCGSVSPPGELTGDCFL